MGEWQAKLSSAPTAAFLFGDFCNKICHKPTYAVQQTARFTSSGLSSECRAGRMPCANYSDRAAVPVSRTLINECVNFRYV
jgi:hypothetical protein